MSERKVINKYYPPDFDPSKVVKKRKKVRTGNAALPTVRLMTPFSLKCSSCGEYISKSRKFNAKKETTDQTYLGMKIIRFHIKCTRCAGEIIFRTDHKSADYVVESGAKRNYENPATSEHQLKNETLDETLARLEKEEKEERAELMKKDQKRTTVEELEEKLNDIRRQQDLHEELEVLKDRNARLESIKVDEFAREREEEAQRLKEESKDDEIAAAAFARAQIPTTATTETKPTDISTISRPGIVTKKRKISKLGIKIKR